MFEYGPWNIWTCSLMILIVYTIYQIILIEFFLEPEKFIGGDIPNTKTNIKALSLAVKKAEEELKKKLNTSKIGIVTLTNYASRPKNFMFDLKIYDYSKHIIQNYHVVVIKPLFSNGEYKIDKLENTDNKSQVENGSFDIINSPEYSELKA